MAAESKKPLALVLGFGPPKPKGDDDSPSETELARADGILSAIKSGDTAQLARMLREGTGPRE